MSYLVCENCGNYYRLQDEEAPDDYSDTCECGGPINYYEYIPILKVFKKCPKCGFEGTYGEGTYGGLKPLSCQCKRCFNTIVTIENECPICNFRGKLLEQRYSGYRGEVDTCPKCGNSFGILIDTSITSDKFYMIRTVGYFITMLIAAILIFKKQFFP